MKDSTDGIYHGCILEFKLNINDLNKTLLQAIKYLSKERIKGHNVPALIFLVDLNKNIVYEFKSKDYFAEIHTLYSGGASKANAGFEADYTLHFTSSDEDGHRVYMILTIKEGNTVLAQVKTLLIGQYYCENLDAQTTIYASATSLTSKATKVSVTVDFDFYTDFIGGDDDGHYGKGLYWVSKGTYIYHLYEYGSFSVGDLYQKPSFRTVSISDRTTKSISVYA